MFGGQLGWGSKLSSSTHILPSAAGVKHPQAVVLLSATMSMSLCPHPCHFQPVPSQRGSHPGSGYSRSSGDSWGGFLSPAELSRHEGMEDQGARAVEGERVTETE